MRDLLRRRRERRRDRLPCERKGSVVKLRAVHNERAGDEDAHAPEVPSRRREYGGHDRVLRCESGLRLEDGSAAFKIGDIGHEAAGSGAHHRAFRTRSRR